MYKQIITSKNEIKTKELSSKIISQIKAPCVLALQGVIGSGKTTFVRGIVNHLSNGLKIKVQSPTFSLAKIYNTNPIVNHIDLYRLNDKISMESFGINDLIYDENAYTCVEWSENYYYKFPYNTIFIKFSENSDDIRDIEITSNIFINLI